MIQELGCKSPFGLVELIEKKLEQFEGSFEHDEVVNL
jgi:hypothetical protein